MAILASTIIKKGARPPRVPSRSLNEIHRLGWRSHSDEWLIKKRSEYISDITSETSSNSLTDAVFKIQDAPL
jgi:hypothetical protein